MLKMLAEVIRAEELLRRVAFPELVVIMEVLGTNLPVLVRNRVGANMAACRSAAWKLLATVTANVHLARAVDRIMERAFGVL